MTIYKRKFFSFYYSRENEKKDKGTKNLWIPGDWLHRKQEKVNLFYDIDLLFVMKNLAGFSLSAVLLFSMRSILLVTGISFCSHMHVLAIACLQVQLVWAKMFALITLVFAIMIN